MKTSVFLRWFRLSFVFFALCFAFTWLVIVLFPDTMLRLFGGWARLMEAAGARNFGDFTSQREMFAHILTTNMLTLIIYCAIGLLLQSPIVMLFAGAFYACIAFLAPFTIGRAFALNDWLLIGVESSMLILGIALASGVGSDLWGVQPDLTSLGRYWLSNWRRFLPRPVNCWRAVLRGWSGVLLLGGAVIVMLQLFVAWFETYGY